jgi:hypothetical protein
MATTIRAAAVTFKGKKIAELKSAKYSISSGDEAQHGSEGVMGYSKGQVMTKISADVVVPVAGLSTTLESALLNKQTVTIGWIGGGKLHQIDMNPMDCEYTSDSKSGALSGTFNFEGGAPDVSG